MYALLFILATMARQSYLHGCLAIPHEIILSAERRHVDWNMRY